MGTFIGLTLFGMNPIMVAVAIAGAVAIGAFLFRKDTDVETRRRHAIEIAQELRVEGLDHVPAILNDYAVGDYSGMANRVKSWYEFLRNDENRRAFLDGFLKKQLSRAMEDPNRRAFVLETVKNWQAQEQVRNEELLAKLTAEKAEKAKSTL